MNCIEPTSPIAATPAECAAEGNAASSHASPPKPRRKPAPLRDADLLAKMLWSVPEAAFMCRIGARTVWRLMADPESGFPRPRRIGRRTLLARDEVLAFLAEGARP